MVSNPLGGSFHTQLVALVMAISVLSVAVLASISINTNQQILKKDMTQRLNVMVSDKMQAIKNLWNLRLEQVESLAADDRIRSFLVDQPAPDVNNITNRVLEFVNLTKGKDSTYVEVRIADETGKVLFSTEAASAAAGTQIMQRDIFDRAFYGSFYTTDFDSSQGIAVLRAVAPVQGLGTSPAGYVVLLRDLNFENQMLADRLFLGETGEMYLVNDSGLMITDSRFVKEAKYTQFVDIPPVQECFRNGADVNGALYQSYRELTVFGASYCDRDIGIVLVSETTSTELFEPLLTLQYQYVLVTGVIIAAAGAAAFFLSLSILKPLQNLRTTMGVVQAGRFEKTDIARRDEIGDLATSFNTMVEEIGIRSKRLALKNDILSFMSSRLEVQADELKKADKEKEEFSVMVSHELKTFLVPVIGYSELLLDGTLGEINPGQKDKVKVILERAWSLLYLTQNILEARQLESGKIKMNMSKTSAGSLVQECIVRAVPLTKSKDASMESSADDDVELWCDPLRIAQVLDNLVSNAIKAIPADSLNKIVRVSAHKGPDHVLFSVQDSGTGIAEDKRQHVFIKFYQVDKSLTRPAGGTGLGLAISKGIVEAHGGKMWFESKPGAGTTFYFSIPFTAEKPR